MRAVLADELFYRKWFGGDWGLPTCRLVIWLSFPSPFCSIWSLAAIAIDRYFAVARPLQLSVISRHIKLVITALWLWSFLSAAGMISMAKLIIDSGEYHVCVMDFSHVKLSAGNIASLFIIVCLNFLVPLVAMSVLYSIVCWRLWSRDVPGEEASQDQRHRQALTTAKKVTRMMIVVVVFFVFCWFPFHFFIVLDSLHKIKLSYAAFKFIVWLANAYSAINPLIYLCYNGKFRQEFMVIMGKCFKRLSCFRCCRCCRFCKTRREYDFQISNVARSANSVPCNNDNNNDMG